MKIRVVSSAERKFFGRDAKWVEANVGKVLEVEERNMNYYLHKNNPNKLIHVYNSFELEDEFVDFAVSI